MIVIGIDDNRKAVGLQNAVAARHLLGDQVGAGVVAADADIQGIIVVEYADLGAFGRRGPLFRVRLKKTLDRDGEPPAGIAEVSVDVRRGGRRRCDDAPRRCSSQDYGPASESNEGNAGKMSQHGKPLEKKVHTAIDVELNS